MTMILADKGDYPTMTRVMELTEKLDRLIARRMEETHEQQRKSFFSDQPGSAKTLDELLSEADQIIARSDYTEAEKTEIRYRITEFDHYFFTFQNETIEQVLMLSEKIDEMRKRFRRVQSG
jgi:predicted ester cyclase